MKYILTAPKQAAFLDFFINNHGSDYEDIEEMVNGCKYFYFKVYANSYFIAKDIQKSIKTDSFRADYIEQLFSISEQYSFFLEELGSEFVSFLLCEPFSKGGELETQLYKVYSQYINRYEQ